MSRYKIIMIDEEDENEQKITFLVNEDEWTDIMERLIQF